MHELIEQAERDLLHTYNRYPIVFDRGEGVYLYDVNGKKYLDFAAGIAVFAFGYGNEYYNNALKDQIDKILHTSNYFYNVPAINAAHRLKALTGMDRVFFTNSGAEAVEGAIKSAMKFGYGKDGRDDHEVIAMEHSFHGRTYGALSVTGNEAYRRPFGPMAANVRFAKLNDIESVKALINDRTCALIMEVVQGEGGLIPAEQDFLKEVRRLCDENDMLLIFDEIQCGMGRTGSMFAFEKYGVRPDIMTLAKALGCGVPVGAFLMTQRAADLTLTAGDHGTTYGGNPFAAAAICAVLDLFEQTDILAHVREMEAYLTEKLDSLKARYPFIVERRGAGLMQGLVFDRPVGPVINKAMEKGLVVISAGSSILRFVPPLVITKENVDEMIRILDEGVSECS
ncbi:MAG: aspartate aminotransferase family protein [Lachnospiraceae bacterium]|nr:aspartate aminotransferase family protein [Lachnospiraceae bacterium]